MPIPFLVPGAIAAASAAAAAVGIGSGAKAIKKNKQAKRASTLKHNRPLIRPRLLLSVHATNLTKVSRNSARPSLMCWTSR